MGGGINVMDIVQTIATVITVGITLFSTVAKPLQKFSQHLAASNVEQMHTNEALKDVNENLKALISENKTEHMEFREKLVDHEKRIYKMEV